MAVFNNGREIVNVDGHFVEKDVLRIVERIRAYDANLDVLYLDPAQANFLDAPYIIVELCPDGQYRRVFEVWDLDAKVLERIWAADTTKHDVQSRLEKANQLAQADVLRRYQEKREESRDVLAHIFASAKGTYTFRNEDGQLVQINDDPSQLPLKVIKES